MSALQQSLFDEPEPQRPDYKFPPDGMDRTADLMRLTVMTGVPLRMAELRRFGGPTPSDFRRIQHYGAELAEKGDRLQFRSEKHPGEAGRMMAGLIDALAVGAFVPGGVTFLGVHFEA